MRGHGLGRRIKRRFRVSLTDSHHDLPIAPNRLRTPPPPVQRDTVWVADITYVATAEGWLYVMEEIVKTKTGENQHRWRTLIRSKRLDLLRARLVIETLPEHFLKVLQSGAVSTNVYLRRIHNFALDMNWLPPTVIPKRQWPTVRYKEKRAVTLEEHQKIIAAEVNPERKVFYQLCWHLGGSQSDIALLKGEDVDWANSTLSFFRKKTGVPVLVHLGPDALNLLKDLPSEGVLFPYLSRVRAGGRAPVCLAWIFLRSRIPRCSVGDQP